MRRDSSRKKAGFFQFLTRLEDSLSGGCAGWLIDEAGRWGLGLGLGLSPHEGRMNVGRSLPLDGKGLKR